MTKTEFLTCLSKELEARGVADAADILEEYEQHFAFKLADGYSEEEIAAKLGTPEALAAQFEPAAAPHKTGRRITAITGLCFADVFGGIFFIFLAAWELVLAASCAAFAIGAVCLFARLNPYGLIPPMPYWCGAIGAVCLLALAVLIAAGFVWYTAFLRQLFRSFCRFQKNVLAESGGRAVLPGLPIAPQFTPEKKRRLRTVALIALLLFIVCFMLTLLACALSAGRIEFWHAWGWFGYGR